MLAFGLGLRSSGFGVSRMEQTEVLTRSGQCLKKQLACGNQPPET